MSVQGAHQNQVQALEITRDALRDGRMLARLSGCSFKAFIAASVSEFHKLLSTHLSLVS